MCLDIIGTLEENSGKKVQELAEEIGIETDEDAGINISNDRTSKLKRGEVE